ncbi:MAG: class I SAM-dependent methyltransferase [Jiangellaceae bacterium]
MSGQPDIDWAEQAAYLSQAARTDADWYRSVASRLVRPTDRLLVDVGCGGGGMAVALALTSLSARVVAVDDEPAVLKAAAEVFTEAGVEVRTAVADAAGDPQVLAAAIGGPADLVWASAVVHHAPDQQATVDVLAGLLAPRGQLALAEGGLPRRHLPWDLGSGRPGLESRLEQAQDAWFAAMRDSMPEAVRMPYGWPSALRRAGLTDVTTSTSLIERPPPLDAAERERVAGKFAHRVEWLREREMLPLEDDAAWTRLLDPEAPEWLGRRDDVFVLDARSVHVGHAGAQ